VSSRKEVSIAPCFIGGYISYTEPPTHDLGIKTGKVLDKNKKQDKNKDSVTA